MKAHDRLTVAKRLWGSSIGRRISLLVALIVTGVVTSVTYLQVRSFEGSIDRDLLNAARLGAQSAADNIGVREQPLDPFDVRDMLHDLIEAEPLIDAISVIEEDGSGHFRIATSTSTEERAEVVDLAGRAITTKGPATDRYATSVTFALPVPRRATWAVAVTVGTESLLQARKHSVELALGFAAPAILLVTVLVHLTVRHLVGQPLTAILETMDRTAEGDLRARTTIARHDELGTIATRLNDMLDQLELFNRSLQERVEDATRALSLRNAELASSQHQLFAARESLAHAERVAALGQVAANVAHQAGTPLNLVSGYVQMILDDPKTDERTRARLQTVDTQIQQVTRVLRTMLDHARQPSGCAIVALAEIIARVADVAQPRLSRSNIRLQTFVADGLPPVNADATQLEMALLNLVTNALDAMRDGGTLSISAAPRANVIRLEISDTGPGLPATILDRLFDPWVTTKPAGQGSGLGLAIVRDVVRAHGGTVSARNQTTGAVFVIELPAVDAAVSA
jgi:two-component system, NtrC family, sensor kinase